MFKWTFLILGLALAAQAKTRNSRLPYEVSLKPEFRREVSERIVGGDEVKPYSIPYQVSLQYTFMKFHFCGGSVLSENYILTAAHCCDGQETGDVKVVTGEHNLAKDEGNEQESPVEKITMHPKYNPSSTSNDVCVIKLAKPLKFNDYVSAVELAEESQSFSGDAVVSGWGTLTSGGYSPDSLRSVTVPLVSEEGCKKAYGRFSIDKSMICAGEEGKDSCQGDSGGPLTCQGVHCGTVSWGYGCAMAEYPGVYSRTSYLVGFIKEAMQE